MRKSVWREDIYIALARDPSPTLVPRVPSPLGEG
jgi:hypothetical protein